MGLLSPEFTGPVTIKLAADDLQRESMGRTLGILGTVTGLIGAGMYLSANPSVKSALALGKPLNMTLTAAEAQRDAQGRSLALIGTSIGVLGSLIAMSGNPNTRAKMPYLAKITKPGALMMTASILGFGLYYMIQKQNAALISRYATPAPATAAK